MTDKSFNREFNFVKGLILLVFLGAVLMIVLRFSGALSGMYEITIPSYSNTAPEVYFTREYTEKDGCIEFKDSMGFPHKFCGAYQITKY